jgi:asparagine synthase (glutamine-hydrolysing)
MCGIAAVVNGSLNDVVEMMPHIQRRGTKTTFHHVGNLHVAFAHLPITNDTYSQPCVYGNVTLWLNGYISNWKELADEFGVTAQSDTELLAWYVSNGQPLNRLNGFFAVLYHDGHNVRMFTDRYGIKQLYTYTDGTKMFICSTVNGILAHHSGDVDPVALVDWHYSLGVMTDNTVYKGIERVECLPFERLPASSDDYDTARFKLLHLWNKSVERNRHDHAGCYLSGGVDSGMIAKSFNPEYCFSVDYLNDLSEIENIKHNSQGLHLTLICNGRLKERSKKLAACVLDDVKAGSCYTNFAIADFASKFVRVVYSGAGGDEVFLGYSHRYDRPINDVIRRTETNGPTYDITHDEYDWRFLRAVLVVEDRMGGHHTLETRYPFLDNDFVDYALSLPAEYRKDKRILKDICGLHPSVVYGKKRGFSNPHFTNAQWAKFVSDERHLYIGLD